jgi:3'-phosphoadenosine 5'-phosphosulfate sulfotransferase (PAPS reductase)/FAD synthetase
MGYTVTDFELGADFTFDTDFLVHEGLFDGDPAELAMTEAQVAALPAAERERRVLHLQNMADLLFYQAGQYARHHGGEHQLAAVVGMFSGGRDSTTTVHAMRRHLTHLVHADTGTCLSQTRKFVRETAQLLGLPLIMPRAPLPQDQYSAMVRDQGFPGPGMHQKMYNRLKERAWRVARRQLVPSARTHRMIQVAGRRRTESERRANVPEMQREYAVVWVSPMVLWTKMDLNTYRRMYDVPVNPVYDLLHYSGECLCGSFAQDGQREWLFEWFADDPAVLELLALEAELASRADIAPERKFWGCGGVANRCPIGTCNE